MKFIDDYFIKKEKSEKREKIKNIFYFILSFLAVGVLYLSILFVIVYTIVYSFLYAIEWFSSDNSDFYDYFCNLNIKW